MERIGFGLHFAPLFLRFFFTVYQMVLIPVVVVHIDPLKPESFLSLQKRVFVARFFLVGLDLIQTLLLSVHHDVLETVDYLILLLFFATFTSLFFFPVGHQRTFPKGEPYSVFELVPEVPTFSYFLELSSREIFVTVRPLDHFQSFLDSDLPCFFSENKGHHLNRDKKHVPHEGEGLHD